ncbi:NADH-quinone oxidoreductase subunit NuoG [Polynucleobacter bastaniensis]|jgi:NADH-quinone oxidoreductase subunit G|uniref:NADH-quinone oxidoreductase subunit NuoG n=1 Tax=Polynucleobacter bastaniensis TaxID=2081039 RepID=UPI001C0B5EC5|nr:NADH-quinone oxidoreductase subunit NuoG [Polynucleobacter bastaniensis]MBU3598631.1 NADH-quinone oxidoreductase subunit G [Polynucleobacter bastaniensis]
MVEIELDGKLVEVPQGSMVMHAANKLDTYIPHFCYHKKLSIAANCRMCLVEVEKAPKPLPACATPVTQGMKVFTHSAKAVEAQRSVMEFLLINHPLDCPICDQGGECQLQDLAVGYGKSNSRYEEEKRVVFHKNVGPLISMQEMTRCIHCTRCVRFGQEVAGVMELGMVNRGEHSEITTFAGQTIDSELSGNMIDICPVGALTSKPFRYAARTWELGRKRSVSPHDSLGANTTIQTKSNKVMRIVALENDAINECWISDRDRFAYEGLNSADRITTPMVKQGGQWLETDWQSAMDYVAHSLKTISAESGPEAVAALAHPISSTEELYLLQKMIRGLGSNQVETRLRQTDVKGAASAPWLGMPISKLSELDRVLVIGSFLRKELPLIAARLRTAAKRGLQVSRIDAGGDDWLIPNTGIVATPSAWINVLSEVALAVAKAKSVSTPAGTPNLTVSATAQKIVDSLLSGASTSVLLGSAAIAHPNATDLHVLAQFIAEQTGATLGFLPVGGNAVGASLVNANGAGVESILSGDRRAVILMNVEPDADLPNPAQARAALAKANTVIALSAYKSADLLEVADVILPISTFTETVSTFVNAEARTQTIQPAVKPLGDSRPAWKVLRVLGSLLNLDGFLYNMPEEVLGEALGDNYCTKLGNQSTATGLSNSNTGSSTGLERLSDVGIYAGDQIVRRAPALQLTRDAKRSNQVGLGQGLFSDLGLKEGDAVRVTQGAQSVDLPVTLEANLAQGAVRISAGTMASAQLGSMFGPVTVCKA